MPISFYDIVRFEGGTLSMLGRIIIAVVGGTIVVSVALGAEVQQSPRVSQAPPVSQAEKPDLRVEKYTGLQAPDGTYDKEAIRITNLGRSRIAIRRVTLNDGQCAQGDTKMGPNGSLVLDMGDFTTEWLCSSTTSILSVQIETMEYNGMQWVNSGSTYTLK
jgi:hypothetical protein